MTRILVIRHGETDWNAARLIQGRSDRPLSEAGRAGLRAARLPSGWADAASFSSPLVRAIETAHLLGLAARPDPRLIEMDWGEWEGRSLAELRAELGSEMSENEERGLDFRPPGGESPRDVQKRLRPLLAELRQPTILITHKGVLRALYAMASGWAMTGKPPHRLIDGRGHSFRVSPDGSPSVDALNVPLEPTV